MRFKLFTICLMSACITDSGRIDSTCDEVPEPCEWEQGEAEDTGGGDTDEDAPDGGGGDSESQDTGPQDTGASG